MSCPAYFWKDEEVITYPGPPSITIRAAIVLDLLGYYCVDTACIHAAGRYGRFDELGWASDPLDSFPKEFRLHLLLLGVT